MVAELVAAVQDPAGHVGVLVEPGADRQYGDPRSRALRLGEDRAPGRGVAVAVEGERDAGAVPGAVRDLHGLAYEPARAGAAAAGAGLAGVGAAGAGALGGVAVPQAAVTAPAATAAPARRADRRSG